METTWRFVERLSLACGLATSQLVVFAPISNALIRDDGDMPGDPISAPMLFFLLLGGGILFCAFVTVIIIGIERATKR